MAVVDADTHIVESEAMWTCIPTRRIMIFTMR